MFFFVKFNLVVIESCLGNVDKFNLLVEELFVLFF